MRASRQTWRPEHSPTATYILNTLPLGGEGLLIALPSPFPHTSHTCRLTPLTPPTSPSLCPATFTHPSPRQVIADDKLGLLFKNKRDRKVLCVDPGSLPGDNSSRSVLATDEYLQVVLYDHVTRRRS